ncbi:PQQ-binding-like beta-propeller repeat protein [Streptomyces sp. NPDC092952]|uniref:caspase, EACC1-associated type n=1 Tax=Streptomyces sp. NPDC092952 TaxID=3366018 RepID=UPI00380E76CE
MRLSPPDPKASRAVLIGSHTYRKLTDLSAVTRNLTGLAGALRHPAVWGLPDSHCTVLDQPESAQQALDALHAQAPLATDTLIVYYAGHGLVDPYTDELYLALPASERGRPDTALRYEYVRRAVLDPAVTARRKVVILDSCYSGRALIGEMGAGDHVTAQALIDGTCLLTSTAETRKSLSFPGERYTAFTGELIGILVGGIPEGPELLDMDTIYREAHARLAAKGRPLPQQRNRNAGGLIVLARNRAHPDSPATDASSDPTLMRLAPSTAPLLGRLPRRSLLAGAAVGTAGLGGAGLGIRQFLLGGEEKAGVGLGPGPADRTTSPPVAPSISRSPTPTTTRTSSPAGGAPRKEPKPGETMWRKKIPEMEDVSDVLLVDDVLVLNLDGTLHGFDRSSGERRWTLHHNAPFTRRLSSAAVSSGILCIEDGNMYLQGVDTRRGTKRWAYRLATTDDALDPMPPCVHGGIVYAARSGAPLYALDAATGRKRWSYAPRGGIGSGPAVNGTVVCVGVLGSTVNYLSAVDLRTGREKWRDSFGLSDYVAIDTQYVYNCAAGTLTGLDMATHERRWSQPGSRKDPTADLQPLTLAGGVLYTTTVDGLLTARDPWTGTPRWRFKVRYGERFATWGQWASGGGATPIVAGQAVYLGSLAYQALPDEAAYREKNRATRFVHAVDAATGTEHWHFEAGGATGTTAVDATTVYVASTDGCLHALAR